jgi:amino acid adenylation domain-containing protein
MDGWCTTILISNFLEIYKSFLENRPYQLPDVTPYRVYIQWLQKQDKEVSKLYWREYLMAYEEQAGIPKQKSFKRHEQDYKKGTVFFLLEQEQTSDFKKLAGKMDVTVNTIIRTAWAILLGKYNDKQDVVFGNVVSGRPSEIVGVETMVGLFINTIPVRIRFEANEKFNDLVRKVQEKALESEPYQYYPLAEVQTESFLKQNLLDHILIYENYPVAKEIDMITSRDGLKHSKDTLRISNVEVFEQTNYDLNVVVIPHEELTVRLEYNGKVYDGDFVIGIADFFNRILNRILTDNEQCIEMLTSITEEEKKRILFDFNDTKADYPNHKTIQRLFAEQVERTPDFVALIQQNSKITYSDLNLLSVQLAHLLTGKGLQVDNIVGIEAERSAGMIIGILGILKAGGAYLPIDPNYPAERKNYMLADSNAKILVTMRASMRWTKTGSIQEIVYIDDHLSPQRRKTGSGTVGTAHTTSTAAADVSLSLSYVIYTSGSTGKPKGVAVGHRSVINRLNWMQRKYPIEPGDVILQKTPFTFDVSVWEIFWWSFQGASLCLLEPGGQKAPEAIIDAAEKNYITTIHFVPSMLNVFLEYLEYSEDLNRLSTLRQVFASGEALSVHHVKTFNRLLHKRNKTKLVNLYGPTEATVDVSFFNCPVKEKIEKIPIGKPIDNIRLYVVNKSMRLQAVGSIGELCISGDGLARGYLNNPELTKEKFQIPDYKQSGALRADFRHHYPIYMTGDLARWLPDGNIEFLGRIDHQVKIRGYRIELAEIENQLRQYPEIKAAVVLAREDNTVNSDQYLCAYMAGDFVSTGSILTSELKRYLSQSLPDYMIPAYFTTLEQIPLTRNRCQCRFCLKPPPIPHPAPASKRSW